MNLHIPYPDLIAKLNEILLHNGFPATQAATLSEVFATNSLEGVYSHGVNRFPKFIKYTNEGHVIPGNEAVKKAGAGCVEQWDGQLGPGPVNAYIATDRAMELARQYGMGCVALANTNHWMRGGTYAWKATRAGFAYIAWSNTIANMPPWGAVNKKLGNNPLIIGVPTFPKPAAGRRDDSENRSPITDHRPPITDYRSPITDHRPPITGESAVLDIAMSQYSFGALEMRRHKNQQLPLPGGYDKHGNLTTDPAAIMESYRPLPIGYWKGAGLALLLDILAATLSGGLSTSGITAQPSERSVSQVFIAVDLTQLHNYNTIGDQIRAILDDYRSATPINDGDTIRYPGENIVRTRKENLEKGVPVLKAKWEEVLGLLERQ